MNHPAQVTTSAAMIPPLALRIGVTGKRPRSNAETEAIEVLRPKVAAVLEFVKQHMHALAGSIAREQAAIGEMDAVPIYQPGEPLLRVLSSLAVGADRLVAQEADRLGYQLDAVLPFARDEYKHDFPHQVGEFEDLLQHAQGRVLELDGGRGPDEPWSYQAAGRVVVQHSDVVIAIWDGKEASGIGGTGDIVPYAIQSGVPVWWISMDPDTHPRLITEAGQLRNLGAAADVAEAEALLADYLDAALVLPPRAPPDRHGFLGWLVELFHRRDKSPLQIYWREGLVEPRWYWHTYSLMMRLLGGAAARWTDMPSAEGQVEMYWDVLYCRADRASALFGNRYRSSYVLILILGTLALTCAALGLALKCEGTTCSAGWPAFEKFFGWSELVLLVLILLLVWANLLRLWQERWISYRMLSELCRKQRVLGTVARALPITKITNFASEPMVDPTQDEQQTAVKAPREIWVSWYFTAQQRAAPLLYGTFDRQKLDRATAVGSSMLHDQITYHVDRAALCREAAGRLVFVGYLLFLATIAAVSLHLIAMHCPECGWRGFKLRQLGPWPGFVAVSFPTFAAALAGIRAYAEFDHLVDVSDSMVAAMKPALDKIKRIQRTDSRVLASGELGERLASVTAAMLQDVQGWAQLFRVKAIEPS